MALNAVPVTADQANEPNVQEVKSHVPGVGEVTTYFRIEHLDDLTGKPADGIETYRMRLPYTYDQEVTERDADGNPVLNEDGSERITTETAIGYEELEVDLSAASFDKFTKALAPFRKSARPSKAPAVATASRASSSRSGPDYADWLNRVRAWAKGAGHDVSDRGRVSQKFKDLYVQNHPDDKEPQK